MSFAVVMAGLFVFLAILRRLRVIALCAEMGRNARGTVLQLSDPALTDRQKELAARQASAAMMLYSLKILAKMIFAILPALLILALSVVAGITSLDALAGALISWRMACLAILLFGASLFL